MNTCPKCNSDNIDHYDVSFEEFDFLEQFVECYDCKFKWIELFKLHKWYPDVVNTREYEPNEKYAANNQVSLYCDRCKLEILQDKFVEHCKEHKDQFNTQDETQGTKGHNNNYEDVEITNNSTSDKSLEVI